MTAAVLVIIGGLVLGRARGPGAAEMSESLWLSEARLAAGVEPRARHARDRHRRAGRPRSGARQLRSWPARRSPAEVAELGQLPIWQRRLLVASGAGAGFAASTTCRWAARCSRSRSCSARSRCPSSCRRWSCAVSATAVAWTVLGTHPIYTLPHYALHRLAARLGELVGTAHRVSPRSAGCAWLSSRSGCGRGAAGRYVAPWSCSGRSAAVVAAVPGAARQRQGRGPARGARGDHARAGARAARPQAVGYGRVLGAGAPGGLFTPTLDDRGAVRRRARPRPGRTSGPARRSAATR